MNLLCPSCQKMLQVPEQYAGQQMRCPLCNNLFTVPGVPETPALAPPPSPPPPPPPPPAAHPEPAAYSFANEPPPPPTLPPLTFEPEKPASTAAPAPPQPTPPLLMGDYTKLRSITISPRVVSWISPAALFFVFLLTFFPWVSIRLGGVSASANAWSLGFGDHGNALFVIYDLLLVFALLTAIASLLMHLKVIPDTPQLRPIEAWRSVIVAAFSGTAFLFLFLRFFVTLFDAGFLPFSFWGLLGYWVHLVAVIGVLLEVWLQRRGPAKPLPRIDIHT